jgi:hypothetical protein
MNPLHELMYKRALKRLKGLYPRAEYAWISYDALFDYYAIEMSTKHPTWSPDHEDRPNWSCWKSRYKHNVCYDRGDAFIFPKGAKFTREDIFNSVIRL